MDPLHQIFVNAQIEVEGLEALGKHVRVPRIYEVGDSFIKMEQIRAGRHDEQISDSLLAKDLISLHKVTNDYFGWHNDNFIGDTVQRNDWNVSWCEFFMEMRLGVQFSLPGCRSLVPLWNEVRKRIREELKCVDEPPSLTHGDLWAGNVLVDATTNSPVFIDPAVSFSHRETDLAMMKLFGGFSERVFEEYNALWPLQPGWQRRNSIYQLYHVLNHVNLFGSSYTSQATRILKLFEKT